MTDRERIVEVMALVQATQRAGTPLDRCLTVAFDELARFVSSQVAWDRLMGGDTDD